MIILDAIGKGLYAAAGMFWTILWALILGFALSGVVMAFVSKSKMVRLLGKPGPKEIGLALFFGAVSSSCSYAAAAMARSIFQKGAHIIPALAFMLASTNLVVELSAILWIMMGWQFVLAEFFGGIILVFVMAGLMGWLAPLQEFEKRRSAFDHLTQEHGHEATADVPADPRRLEGWRRVARSFTMEWRMIWKDIALGVVIGGFVMALVPDTFWQTLFLQNGSETHGMLQIVENSLVGPIISAVSFVCSIGNIPVASALYHGGITFGGTISFIYADLIIIPLILVYRKYYGWKLTIWITGVFYVSMVVTGIAVELIFSALGWMPHRHAMRTMDNMHFFELNYTLWLNIAFLVIAGILVWLSHAGGNQNKADESCCH